MIELPYFKFYIAEWLTGDIHDMPTLSQGFFIKFLVKAWGNGGYLDNDSLLQQKLNICSTADEQAFKLLIDHKIIKEKDGKLFSCFQLEQIKDFLEELKQKSKAGKASAKARALKRLNSTEIKHLTDTQHKLNRISTEDQRVLNSVPTHFNEEKEKEKEKESNKENTPIVPRDQVDFEMAKKVINDLFGRRSTTDWSGKETAKLKEVMKRGDWTFELTELEEFYKGPYLYKRKDIITFLNNWTTELDRVRDYAKKQSKVADASNDQREFKSL